MSNLLEASLPVLPDNYNRRAYMDRVYVFITENALALFRATSDDYDTIMQACISRIQHVATRATLTEFLAFVVTDIDHLVSLAVGLEENVEESPTPDFKELQTLKNRLAVHNDFKDYIERLLETMRAPTPVQLFLAF